MTYTQKHSRSAGLACHGLTLLAGLAVGAACMYLFDPNRGRRRRALARDKSIRYAHDTGNYVRRKSKYHWQRAQGMAHEVAAALCSDDPTTDRQLQERVRAALGRVVSNPAAVEVSARDGVISLEGLVAGDEVDALLEAVCRVRSVCDVVNRLEVSDSPQHVPGLQRR